MKSLILKSFAVVFVYKSMNLVLSGRSESLMIVEGLGGLSMTVSWSATYVEEVEKAELREVPLPASMSKQ